ncbi:MAG: hypothetical protein AAFQ51_06725, partial [Pseudomonadota bacterium]
MDRGGEHLAAVQSFFGGRSMDDQEKVLVQPQPVPAGDVANNTVRVAREHGVHPFKQMIEMIRLRRKPSYLSAHEYFGSDAYRPDLTLEQKRQFVGLKGSQRLNRRLSPPALGKLRAFANEKVLMETALRSFGLKATHTQAVI